jgi:hypothetical protein
MVRFQKDRFELITKISGGMIDLKLFLSENDGNPEKLLKNYHSYLGKFMLP